MVKYKLGFAEMEQGKPATVKDAAMTFKEIAYEYRSGSRIVFCSVFSCAENKQNGYIT